MTSKLLATSVSAQAGGCRRCVIERQEAPTVCSRSRFTATSTAIFQYLHHEVSISVNSLPYLRASVCLSVSAPDPHPQPPRPCPPPTPPPPPNCFSLFPFHFRCSRSLYILLLMIYFLYPFSHNVTMNILVISSTVATADM